MLPFIFIFVYTILINQFQAAKILAVFPVPSISHQVVFRPLTQELAKRGHEVVVITPDPAFEEGKTPQNLIEIDVHNISYTKWAEIYKRDSVADGKLEEFLKTSLKIVNDIVEKQIKIPIIQNLIEREKFDLLLIEACVRPALVYSYIFKAPVIQVASFGFMPYNVATIGASWNPLLYPNHYTPNFHYNLTKLTKLEMLWNQFVMKNIQNSAEEVENAMLKRMFGANAPTINDLNNNVNLMLLNVHPLWESNRPVPPSVVYIWGIHEKPKKELPQDLKKYLDSSKNGVIYLSFGTNVRSRLLPSEKVQMFVKTFSRLPYDILWKWDEDTLPGRTENIRISKWLPQSDLLRHPKIKLFITQGGLQSLGEAITAGVPLIGIPMLADQWHNVGKVIYHKIGMGFNMNTLNEDQLTIAIENVIQDTSYRRNVIRLKEIMIDEPLKPLERAVWWTEYVLRHGGARHLRTPAANMSWRQYLEVDLMLTIFFVFIIILFGLLTLILIIWQHCLKFLTDHTKKVKIS